MVVVFLVVIICHCHDQSLSLISGVGSCLIVVRPLQKNQSINLLESYLCYKNFHISSGIARPFSMLWPRKPGTVCSNSYINCVGS